MKKLTALVLAFALAFAVGCVPKAQSDIRETDGTAVTASPSASAVSDVPLYYICAETDEAGDFEAYPNNNMSELTDSEGYNYSFSVEDNGITVTSPDGIVIKPAMTGVFLGFFTGSGERVYALATVRNTTVLSYIDFGGKQLVSKFEPGYGVYKLFPGDDKYDFYYSSGGKLVGLDIDAQTADELLTWYDVGIDAAYLTNFASLPDNGYICSVRNPGSADKTFYTLIPTTEKIEKEVITLAMFSPGSALLSTIFDFNRKNPEYQIEILDYTLDDGQTYGLMPDANGVLRLNDALPRKLLTEITAGRVPDIIDVSMFPVERYAHSGLFVDLYPYIDADPGLEREDILPNILKALEIDGQLYNTLSNFSIATLVGQKTLVGEDFGLTLDDLIEMQNNVDEPLMNEFREFVLYDLLAGLGDSFINWDSGECGFDSAEFIKLLEFVKRQQSYSQFAVSGFDNYYHDHLLYTYQITLPVSDFMELERNYGVDGYTFKGYPTDSGSGSFIKSVNSPQLAITSASKYKDVAWRLVREMFLPEMQAKTRMSLQTNREALEKNLETLNLTLDGSTAENPLTRYISGEEKAVLYGLLDTADKLYRTDAAALGIIMEEVSAFFADAKTAEETAKIIQSRVSIYVNERL
ncbi:MAG: hypothetical protein LBN97_08970 [Oscillospiraceae bacterium]|jgi:hypothetical protein|nr:hypothetical protein [Oscillospiraceae bacterium]